MEISRELLQAPSNFLNKIRCLHVPLIRISIFARLGCTLSGQCSPSHDTAPPWVLGDRECTIDSRTVPAPRIDGRAALLDAARGAARVCAVHCGLRNLRHTLNMTALSRDEGPTPNVTISVVVVEDHAKGTVSLAEAGLAEILRCPAKPG